MVQPGCRLWTVVSDLTLLKESESLPGLLMGRLAGYFLLWAGWRCRPVGEVGDGEGQCVGWGAGEEGESIALPSEECGLAQCPP